MYYAEIIDITLQRHAQLYIQAERKNNRNMIAT